MSVKDILAFISDPLIVGVRCDSDCLWECIVYHTCANSSYEDLKDLTQTAEHNLNNNLTDMQAAQAAAAQPATNMVVVGGPGTTQTTAVPIQQIIQQAQQQQQLQQVIPKR